MPGSGPETVFDKYKDDYLFYFSRLLDKVLVKPEMIQIMLTSRCNIRCRICDVWKQQFANEMTTDEVKSLIDQALDIGVKTIYFTGGEALLRPDILELVNYAAHPGIITTVNTNGSLVTAELAEKIVASKLNNITFSIDGASAETHNLIRGKGVFEKAISGIKLINYYKNKFHRNEADGEERRLAVGMVSVIMKNNIDEIIHLVNLAKGVGCCYLAFQPLVYNGSLLENVDFKSEFMIGEEEIRKLDDSFKKLELVREEMLPGGFMVDFMREKTIQHFRKERKVNTCFAGFSRIFVNPNGDISFVCFESFGNIKSDRLKDVWYGQKADAIRKNIKACKVNCTQFCSERPDSESPQVIHENFKKAIFSRFQKELCGDLLRLEDNFLSSASGDVDLGSCAGEEISKIRQDIGSLISPPD
jgi:MoaA/NifB/PqqE/SkfB family radical SAM enzyme